MFLLNFFGAWDFCLILPYLFFRLVLFLRTRFDFRGLPRSLFLATLYKLSKFCPLVLSTMKTWRLCNYLSLAEWDFLSSFSSTAFSISAPNCLVRRKVSFFKGDFDSDLLVLTLVTFFIFVLILRGSDLRLYLVCLSERLRDRFGVVSAFFVSDFFGVRLGDLRRVSFFVSFFLKVKTP